MAPASTAAIAPNLVPLTTAQVAERLGVCRLTVYRMIRSGVLPHTRVGSSIRIRARDVDAYLEAHTSRTWKRVDGRGRRPGGTAA